MARQPRFYYPGAVLHVIQRGNNREPIFARAGDYRFYLDCLVRAIRRHGVLVHAYVLMTNHIHVLAAPQHKESLPSAMQSVGRRYVQYFNSAHQRTGTLWEGRYRSTVIHSERYLLTCMRYIELNPVRAGMVDHPAGYRWTSYHANAQGAPDVAIEHHELYNRLGPSALARQEAYRDLFRGQISQADLEAIRHATNRSWALGDGAFKRRIERLSGRRSGPLAVGRRPATRDRKFESDPQNAGVETHPAA